MNRTALTIRMLMILKARATREPISTKVLAQELETNPRNIREFKKELITAGYDIREKKGPYGGYILEETSLFPVPRLSAEEIQALNEVREFMSHHKEIPSYRTFQNAMDKVLDVSMDLPKVQIQYLEGIGQEVSSQIRSQMDMTLQAIRHHQSLDIIYQGVHDRMPQTLRIDPYDIVHYRSSYYLVAYAHNRLDYRIYRFSEKRMKQVLLTTEFFLWDNQYQLTHIISRFGLVKQDMRMVKVFVAKEMVDRFEEYEGWGIDLQKIKVHKKGNVYTFKNADRYELYRQIFSFDGQIQILQPQIYREEFLEKIKKWIEIGDVYDDSCD